MAQLARNLWRGILWGLNVKEAGFRVQKERAEAGGLGREQASRAFLDWRVGESEARRSAQKRKVSPVLGKSCES